MKFKTLALISGFALAVPFSTFANDLGSLPTTNPGTFKQLIAGVDNYYTYTPDISQGNINKTDVTFRCVLNKSGHAGGIYGEGGFSSPDNNDILRTNTYTWVFSSSAQEGTINMVVNKSGWEVDCYQGT